MWAQYWGPIFKGSRVTWTCPGVEAILSQELLLPGPIYLGVLLPIGEFFDSAEQGTKLHTRHWYQIPTQIMLYLIPCDRRLRE